MGFFRTIDRPVRASRAATGRVISRNALLFCSVLCSTLIACGPPKITPLQGIAPERAELPVLELPVGQRQVTFRWELNEESMVARGDGIARMAAPDSARVDLFLGGGFGATSAILVGDSLRTPPGANMAALVPPAPLLWAALGRLALPALPDTTVRIAGDTVRAEIGRPVQWRVMAVEGVLRRVERVANGRIVEFVDRNPGKRVRYELASRRSLELIVGDEKPATLDASIWRY